MAEKKVVTFKSWTVTEDTVIKHMDMSTFRHHGTTVFSGAYPFFGVSDLPYGVRKDIRISIRGEEFNAYLNREKKGTIRMFWPEMHRFINSVYVYDEDIDPEELPYMIFVKDGEDRFLVDISYFKPSMERIAHDVQRVDEVYEGEGDIDIAAGSTEGGRKGRYSSFYERNLANRINAIKIHGLTCQICGFNFEETYGERGKDFIEVHHVKPLYQQDGPVRIDPEKDLACVCSNCHSIIHRVRDDVLTIEEMREIVRAHKKQ